MGVEYEDSLKPSAGWYPLDGRIADTFLACDLFSRIGSDCFEPGMGSRFDWDTDCKEMSGFHFSISLGVLFPAPAALISGLCLTFFRFLPLGVFDAFRLLVATFACDVTSSF